MPTAIAADRPVRWGFVGAGAIADKFARDMAASKSNTLAAVAARSLTRAQAFAMQHGAERAYGNYQQLVDDPAVDVVYIATTHPQHYDQALMAIEAGKPVLIEKPVCLNAAQTLQVFKAAEAAGVFAMEAMWMRLNPLIRTAQSMIANDAIGKIESVTAEMTLGMSFNPQHRLFDRANGGGSLLDLGIYPLTFAWIFLGKPNNIQLSGRVGASDVDETVAMLCDYDSGATAQLFCSATIPGPYRGLIQGSKGWIRTEGRFHRPSALTVQRAKEQTVIADPLDQTLLGYLPQIEEVERCLRAGELTSPLVPPIETVAIMSLIDDMRASLGVKYPSE